MFQKPGYLAYTEAWLETVARVASQTSEDDLNKTLREAGELFKGFVLSRDAAVVFLPDGGEFEVGPYFIAQFYWSQRRSAKPTWLMGTISNVRQFEYLTRSARKPVRSAKDLANMMGLTAIQFLVLLMALLIPSLSMLFAISTFDYPGIDFVERSVATASEFRSDMFGYLAYMFAFSTLLVLTAAVVLQRKTYIPLGGLSGGSLCFPVLELQDYFSQENADKDAAVSKVSDERNFAERIVKAFDGNPNLVKAEMKAISKNIISARGFERAWAMAREKRPQLGTPGRKRKG